MNRKLYALLLALLLATGCWGCGLAHPEWSAEAAPAGDRLIGVYVTTEYLDLFDFDGWAADNGHNINGDIKINNAADYTRRLYAEVEALGGHSVTVAFPGVEGWLLADRNLLLHTLGLAEPDTNYSGDLGGPDSPFEVSYGIHDTDDIKNYSLSGTLYYTALPGKHAAFYANPVYLADDGQVYLLPGTGISFDCSPGASSSQSLSESNTVTRNGESKTEGFEVTATYECVAPAEQYRFVFLGSALQILGTMECTPALLPDSLTLPAGTECLLVEQQYTAEDGSIAVQRQIASRSQEFTDLQPAGFTGEAGTFLLLRVPDKTGVCRNKPIRLITADEPR